MRKLLLLAAPLLFTSCISYSVGTTARPIPKGEFQPNLGIYAVPNGIEAFDSDGDVDESMAYTSADFEGRWGLSDRSDFALRVPAGSGAIVSYKRLLSATNDPDKNAFSAIVGTGIVNFGNHLFIEGGLIGSGAEDGRVPYGGIRAMHVFPISTGAVSDTPTVGIFGGVRLRLGSRMSISPELGIYHDESALEIRERDIIFIPSLTLHWH